MGAAARLDAARKIPARRDGLRSRGGRCAGRSVIAQAVRPERSEDGREQWRADREAISLRSRFDRNPCDGPGRDDPAAGAVRPGYPTRTGKGSQGGWNQAEVWHGRCPGSQESRECGPSKRRAQRQARSSSRQPEARGSSTRRASSGLSGPMSCSRRPTSRPRPTTPPLSSPGRSGSNLIAHETGSRAPQEHDEQRETLEHPHKPSIRNPSSQGKSRSPSWASRYRCIEHQVLFSLTGRMEVE
jgi:hypothetical protein